MQHLCARLINPFSRLVKQSQRSLQIILVLLHLSNMSLGIHTYHAYLELDVSKCVIVAEPVISNTVTIHLESGLSLLLMHTIIIIAITILIISITMLIISITMIIIAITIPMISIKSQIIITKHFSILHLCSKAFPAADVEHSHGTSHIKTTFYNI